jgi:hypothetical protein
MYIDKGSRHLPECHAAMYGKEQSPFAWSTTGWTDNELGLECVEQNFEKYTTEMFVP